MSNYKAPSFLSIPNYFKVNDISLWSLDDYCNQLGEDMKGAPLSAHERMYIDYLNLIKSDENLPRIIKSKIGALIKGKEKNHETKNRSINQVDNTESRIVLNINNSNNTSIGNCIISNHEDICWQINDQEDVWSAWKQYLESHSGHEYCLEKAHVIECGYSISCKPHYPEDLYQLFGDNKQQVIKSPFKKCSLFSSAMLQALSTGSKRVILRALTDDSHLDKVDEGDKEAAFVHGYFEYMYNFYKSPSLGDNEVIFNHKLIWPLFEMACSHSCLKFIPGEVLLSSTDEPYNADAVVKFENIEICLLETSGHYGLNDKGRFGYDHVKGAFGAISMIRHAYKKYQYATKTTAQELRVFFMHAKEKKLNLWSLEFVSLNVQILQRIAVADIPETEHHSAQILHMGNFAYKLQTEIASSVDVLKKMRKEHNDYMISAELSDEHEERESLASFVSKSIQKPVKGSGYGLLLPEELEKSEVKTTFV
ncbi:uncharacterized protein RHIMIDRAFT_305694 [Rhizopus microsporus ATCC 52813]|uniref:Uncharacterized protein n=1 Tax=Rhizopus microsporus ATCC 52813 TaxID=1340429 RepID=A0A2G4SY29_RHIZD|nr:uncharacterized protein RHIMIDRAFT_305694 [Rhizopus microsporus ATCC 52813]PHZ13654.1 hypothetical protein RHIMIDRAFT_305694 [Rhizopus microsporus ATCC 52813]